MKNMSNNSYVVEDGEMGRAQVEQAWAAGVEPHVFMNPILLKPASETNAQVILNGKILYHKSQAKDYFNIDQLENLYKKHVKPSLSQLQAKNDFLIIEGAGSCAEVNLWKSDIVNWKIVQETNAKVILVADIDRCGVFAQLLGTLSVLPEDYKKHICGFIINKFRGDIELFKDGIEFIEKQSNLPVLGVLPMNRDIHIDSEDGLMPFSVVDPPISKSSENSEKIKIAVILLPHASNITDFHPLEREPCVSLHYLYKPRNLSGYDLVLLPGSKNTIDDLRWLINHQWNINLNEFIENNGVLGGICGGYQMMGYSINDEDKLEGEGGCETGLGYLSIVTNLYRVKHLKRSSVTISSNLLNNEFELNGYEIHTGDTFHVKTEEICKQETIGLHSKLKFDDGQAKTIFGAQSTNGRIWGTYLHGLFDNVSFRHSLLRSLKLSAVEKFGIDETISLKLFKEEQYNNLEKHMRSHVNINLLEQLLSK